MDAVEKIARTCLYEGYLLWPYRKSALKNTRRWTFGGVFPQSRATALGEPGSMRTDVLIETDEADGADRAATVGVRIRFLHLVERRVLREGRHGPEPVEELTVGDRRYVSWQEATEREIVLPPWTPAEAGRPRGTAIDVPAGQDEEPLTGPAGHREGTVLRSWKRLTGTVETEAVPVADGAYRLTVRIHNTTPCPHPPDPGRLGARDEMAAYAFLSTHTVLDTGGGHFLSLTDPPDHLRQAAADCANTGTWPVLVAATEPAPGQNRQRAGTVLSSPVTLYDFPAVAPESPGDLFDGLEIDQLLILSILSMSEAEQEQARACDPKAREILDRCAALGPDELMALHGGARAGRRLEDV